MKPQYTPWLAFGVILAFAGAIGSFITLEEYLTRPRPKCGPYSFCLIQPPYELWAAIALFTLLTGIVLATIAFTLDKRHTLIQNATKKD
jgi:hypothetical protein